MALCIACSSETHEKEDCDYRGPAAQMWRSGIAVSPSALREIDDAARP